MIHPIREFHHDPLGAGVFYGSLSVAAAALSLVPGSYSYLPLWLIFQALAFAVFGILVIIVSVILHRGGHHDD